MVPGIRRTRTRMALRKALPGVVMIALIVVGAAPASGQGTFGADVLFGPVFGVQQARGADRAEVTGGIALRSRLVPLFGIEGAVQYRQEDYGDGAVTVRAWPVTLSGLVYLAPSVCAVGGGGWYHATFDYDESLGLEDRTQSTRDFGWHVGAGVEYALGSSTTLVADARYVFLDYAFQEVPGLHEEASNFYVVSAGLLFGLTR